MNSKILIKGIRNLRILFVLFTHQVMEQSFYQLENAQK